MKQYVFWMLALGLLALVACASPVQPAQQIKPQPAPEATPVPAVPTAAPTAVLPTLDRTRLPRVPDLSQDPSQDARTIKDWFRQETGLREQLGPEADELFRLMDLAETEAVQNVLQQLKTRGKPKGMPPPPPPEERPPSRRRAV